MGLTHSLTEGIHRGVTEEGPLGPMTHPNRRRWRGRRRLPRAAAAAAAAETAREVVFYPASQGWRVFTVAPLCPLLVRLPLKPALPIFSGYR